MAEQSKINQTSGSQSTENTSNNLFRNPLPKRIPRKCPTQRNRKISQIKLDIHNSPYFKIRSLVRELRPHSLERLSALGAHHTTKTWQCLRPSNFRYSFNRSECLKLSALGILPRSERAAETFFYHLKHFVVLVLQTPDFQNCNGAHEIGKRMKLLMDLYKQMIMEAAPTGKFKNLPEHQPSSGTRRGRLPNQSKQNLPERVPRFEKPLQPPHFSHSDSQLKGSYVVGGSSLGLNFITYRGDEPVYYGVTKEMRRHSLVQKKAASP